MITQQARDHAQACYDATGEAAIHSHMGDAQKAAYMTILANYKPVVHSVRQIKPRGLPFPSRRVIAFSALVVAIASYPTVRNFLMGVIS